MAVRSMDRTDILRNRARLVFGCVLLGYSGLVGRLVYLQGIRGSAIRTMAIGRRTGKIPLPARRGSIFDRTGAPCALSIATANIGFDPSLFATPPSDSRRAADQERHLKKSVGLLAGILRCPESEVAASVQRARDEYPLWIATKKHKGMVTILQSARFALIRRNVDADTVAQVTAKRVKLNGFWLEDNSRRTYMLGDSGLQVVGYVNDYNKPISGLELTCNHWLDRHPGYLVTERDARGRQIPGTETRTELPRDGADVHLAIDTSIQKIVRDELETAFAKYHPNGAEAVVVDPATGDILAMVSLPTFDPNGENQWPTGRNINMGDYQLDRNACRVYEPGSTFKTLAIASAIDRGLISANSYFHCGGGLRVNNRTIHDSHSEVHGDLRPEDILRVSCNVCTAQIGMKLGLPNLYESASQFGLGTKLNTFLPMEQRGRMPVPERKQYSAQAARVAFGQAITTTPLHLAMAYGAIANQGVLMKPRLVTKLTRGDKVIQKWEPTRVRQAVSARTSEQMMGMLTAVVTSGTGRPAAVRGYTVAGKTGTASKYRKGAYVGSFIGVVPTAPTAKFRAVILVALDEPRGAFFGAEVAAPVFQQIATRLMSLKGVAEDDPAWTQYKAAHSPAHAQH